MRLKHPDWIWNRSDTHVFLSEPGALEPFKVVVEPGNSFSPGVGTFGVSPWIYDPDTGKLLTPEEMPVTSMNWSFLHGSLPVLLCSWMAGDILFESRLFVKGDNARSDYRAFYRIRLTTISTRRKEVMLMLSLRSFGAAGAPVYELETDFENQTNPAAILVNGAPSVYCGTRPGSFSTVSYEDSRCDISVFARTGCLPLDSSVTDPSGWASGAAVYNLALEPEKVETLDFMFPIQASSTLLAWLNSDTVSVEYDKAEESVIGRWEDIYSRVRLTAPDKRFTDAFYCQIAHQYMATVHDDVRISPISYPMGWLRDGIYILNSLDKAGLHEFVGSSCEHIAPLDAFGGMGAEGDGPGESIWALSEHFFLTRDMDYLHKVFPHIVKKADLLVQMRHTEVPIKRLAEFRTSEALLSPVSDILCAPSDNGLIVGRMDWHYPTFWVNGFAYTGLMRAAQCAKALGEWERADGWSNEARELKETLMARLQEFGENERDLTGVIWPARAIDPDNPKVVEAYDRFWDGVRCPEGFYKSEPLWTYFELGQAHNYLFLRQRDRMWISLDHYLEHHCAQGLYTYSEGSGDENSSGLWQKLRGWDKIPCVTPHGWTGAELFLLLRDSLVYEDTIDGRGALIIGAGVPERWFKPYPVISITDAPTYYGKCSWSLIGQRLEISVETIPDGGLVIDLPGDRTFNPVTEGLCLERLPDTRYIIRGSATAVLEIK